jgi:hypothetical protein
MFGIFRKAPPPAQAPVDTRPPELERLLHRVDGATPAEQGTLLHRAGELAAAGGMRARAKELFGRAIDAFLMCGRYDDAVVTCRALLAFDRNVVRAHCTLAFIAIGKRELADAVAAIQAYAEAAVRTRTHKYAIPRLQMMERATADVDVRRAIGTALVRLNDPEGERLLASLLTDPQAGARAPAAEEDRWKELLGMAAMDAGQLWTLAFSRVGSREIDHRADEPVRRRASLPERG